MRFRGGRCVLFASALALAAVTAATPALAVVKREGAWPEPEKDQRVTLDVSRVARDEAIRKLAEAAGWSVVVHAPQADPVDVHVKDQPAGRVLDLLLLDADYVATRDGTLVSIRRAGGSGGDAPKADAPDAPKADAPAADAPKGDAPAADAPKGDAPAADTPKADAPKADAPKDEPKKEEPAPPRRARGRDREVVGESLKIAKDEIADDVSVIGGSLDVYGTVTGDIGVAGGTIRIHKGARVYGDVSTLGGDVEVESGGRIDGEVEVAGGSVRRAEGAIIGGEIHYNSLSRGKGPGGGRGAEPASADKMESAARGTASKVGSAFARMALLFVLGTVLLALAPERMDALKAELCARPMRTFAMGVLGVLGAAAAFLLLCVTVIGIPFAILGALAAILAVIAGKCAVLETVGRALTRQRTQNPYVHLAVGCALYLGASAIPFVGGIVVLVVTLLAAGMLVSTHGAGLVQKRLAGAQPYRAAVI